MHGACKVAEVIVRILHGAHDNSTLDYFLRPLYEVFDTSQKDILQHCAMFNTFVDTFRKKLLMLLDNVEQFFLWVAAAMLDGRRIVFD